MQVNVSDAKAQLLDLVRRAEAGEEVILLRRGAPAVRLVPIIARPSPDERRSILEAMFGCARTAGGSDSARSQDFLYDEKGLPN